MSDVNLGCPCRNEVRKGEIIKNEDRRTARGPLSATKFFLTLSMAASGITVRPSFSMGVTSTGSHLMGTLAAVKMSLTAWEISGPIPSPSIKVTAYLPYANQLQSFYLDPICLPMTRQ